MKNSFVCAVIAIMTINVCKNGIFLKTNLRLITTAVFYITSGDESVVDTDLEITVVLHGVFEFYLLYVQINCRTIVGHYYCILGLCYDIKNYTL